MKKLIANGTLCFEEGAYKANLLIENDRIVAICTSKVVADEIIDAEDCLIFPGFIDPHTHFELSPNKFEVDSVAAALGGTTTVLEFANQNRGTTMHDGLKTWHEWAAGTSINYGIHMSLSEWTKENKIELSSIFKDGVSSFKMYMVYDDLMIDDEAMYLALKEIKQYGGILGVHCENGKLIEVITDEIVKTGILSPAGHPLSRPAYVEAEAIARFLRIAALAKAPAYIVHLSTKEGLEEALNARKRGQEVYIETCPQYLILTEDCYDKNNGAKYIMAPPLRSDVDRRALWDAVKTGQIDTIGTDHCSFSSRERKENKDDFRKIPGGCAGVEHRASLMYTYGVNRGMMTIENMTALLSTNVAKIFGVPERGSLHPGNIADVVIWNPDYSYTIRDDNHHQDCDESVYAGLSVKGRARDVFLGGNPIISGYKPLVLHQGKYIYCKPRISYRGV